MLMLLPISAYAQQRVSEDRDLFEINLQQWDCVDRFEGTAKTRNGLERDQLKNRGADGVFAFGRRSQWQGGRGPAIESIGKSKYHHPWRSTAREIHPVIKIEPAEAAGSPNPANGGKPGSGGHRCRSLKASDMEIATRYNPPSISF